MDIINNQMLELWHYLTGIQLWASIAKALIRVFFIIIMAKIIIHLGKKVINRLFNGRKRGHFSLSERREETLKKLIDSILMYVVYFIAFIMILETLNMPISSVLAGAGVAGIAIGFGAQNLVRDIISGFFIIFEDQFSVGDYIVASEVEGEVEEIGLRTTKIKSWTGEQHVIPNGNITQVTNYSVHNGLAVVDINIPYENDVTIAEKLIEDILMTIPAKYEKVVTTPVIHGVQTLELSHFVIRVIAETKPVYQWSGARAIRKEVKEQLYNKGIDIPSPRLVMYTRNEHPTAAERRERNEYE